MNETIGRSGSQDLLVQAAARLYTLGVDLEGAKAELLRLVKEGVPYDAGEMRAAWAEYEALDTQWKSLEQEYLALRRERKQTQEKMEQLLRLTQEN